MPHYVICVICVICVSFVCHLCVICSSSLALLGSWGPGRLAGSKVKMWPSVSSFDFLTSYNILKPLPDLPGHYHTDEGHEDSWRSSYTPHVQLASSFPWLMTLVHRLSDNNGLVVYLLKVWTCFTCAVNAVKLKILPCLSLVREGKHRRTSMVFWNACFLGFLQSFWTRKSWKG